MKKDTQRCLTAVQVVIDLGTVIAVHCSRGIIQRRQQVGFDVSNLRRVLVDAQLQEIISLWHKIPGEARGSAYVMIKGMLIAAQQLPQK